MYCCNEHSGLRISLTVPFIIYFLFLLHSVFSSHNFITNTSWCFSIFFSPPPPGLEGNGRGEKHWLSWTRGEQQEHWSSTPTLSTPANWFYPRRTQSLSVQHRLIIECVYLWIVALTVSWRGGRVRLGASLTAARMIQRNQCSGYICVMATQSNHDSGLVDLLSFYSGCCYSRFDWTKSGWGGGMKNLWRSVPFSSKFWFTDNICYITHDLLIFLLPTLHDSKVEEFSWKFFFAMDQNLISPYWQYNYENSIKMSLKVKEDTLSYQW